MSGAPKPSQLIPKSMPGSVSSGRSLSQADAGAAAARAMPAAAAAAATQRMIGERRVALDMDGSVRLLALAAGGGSPGATLMLGRCCMAHLSIVYTRGSVPA